MKIQLGRNLQPEILPGDALYVSQDNYEVITFPTSQNYKYLYCDSATSCIIIIVTGRNRGNMPCVAISHLSRPERFDAFFKIVEKTFKDGISIFAHGANPPQPGTDKYGMIDFTALRNINIVNGWVFRRSMTLDSAQSPKINQATLIFGEGNPSLYENNLDCYGVDISNPKEFVVSNRRFELTHKDRDISGGLQSLFCPYGLKLGNPNDPEAHRLVLIQATRAFDKTNPDSLEHNRTRLLEIAYNDDYQRYADMTDEEILKECSSTPDAEVPWFCSTIREAANFVKNNFPLLNKKSCVL